MTPLAAGLVIAAVLAPALAGAQGRTFRWKSLDVAARLEATGALHVTERHHVVFNGDWNGGERPFRGGSARPQLISLTRVDPRTMRSHRLSQAGSSAMSVDEYAWVEGNLRWRARRATDPPFRNHEAIYVVEYLTYPVVMPAADRYRMHHDFAFTGRPGIIERFTLDLAFDEGWERAPGVTLPLERENLGPQQTVTLDLALRWTGAGRPRYVAAPAAAPLAAVSRPAPPPPPTASSGERTLVFALFVVLASVMTVWFLGREAAVGAFGPSPEITPGWLDENIFRHRAEVIGVAWDGETGHAEAAALIAILVAEKKVANIPGTPGERTMFGGRDAGTPRLKLLVPRESLAEYERGFVDRLFVDGDEIDPDTLKRHYAGSGFNPADAIRAPLEEAARELVDRRGTPGIWLVCVAGIAIVGFGLPLAGIYLLRDDQFLPFFAGAFLFTASIGLAGLYRTRLKGRVLGGAIALPMFAMAAVLAANLTDLTALELFLGVTLVLLALAFQTARTTGTPRDQENLRALRATRRFFQRRLRTRDVDIDEHWVPYLLAFGLGKDLDRWAVAAPPRPRDRDPDWPVERTTPDAAGGRAASADAGPSFRPGGGAFGGAGASGTWASSIGAFAAVVPAPAPVSDSSGSSSSSDWSSSSSSSDSGGGSSSGGGSGGAW